MKRLLVLVGVLLCGIVYSQKDYNSSRDVIYPYDENISVIREVKIIDVVDGNIVIYMRGENSYQINAKAIYRNGNYSELTKQNDEYISPSNYDNKPLQVKTISNHETDPEYLRFQSLYKSAKGSTGTGVVFTLLGLAGQIAGYTMLYDEEIDNDQTGAILYLGGFVFFNIGIPLWISGGVKKRNNYNAMQKRKNELSLSLKPSAYGKGIGICLSF